LDESDFGDINDYRKYGLLCALTTASCLSLGVCWLRTENDQRKDGESRQYLKDPSRWRSYDPELYEKLRKLLRPNIQRSVVRAEDWEIIPQATYYQAFLHDDGSDRSRYFAEVWTRFINCPILFFDPDNGLEIKSVSYGRCKSSKYLYWRELQSAFNKGHSLVIYQHFPRKPREKFIYEKVRELSDCLSASNVDSFRTANVVFFLVAQQEHLKSLRKAHELIADQWESQIYPAAHCVR